MKIHVFFEYLFLEPCPSPKFQSILADILMSESDIATRFLDTLLNQLNWSFSEFIGMMQEVICVYMLIQKVTLNYKNKSVLVEKANAVATSRLKVITDS